MTLGAPLRVVGNRTLRRCARYANSPARSRPRDPVNPLHSASLTLVYHATTFVSPSDGAVTNVPSSGRVLVTALVLSALGLVALPSGADAAPTASGNARAISLYATAVHATNGRPVLQDTSANTYFLEDSRVAVTTPSSFSYVVKAALPTIPAGFVRATTVTTYRLVHGIVTWSTTVVTPECSTPTACAKYVGLEFYDTPTQEKMALLIGPPRNYCWAQTQPISLASFAFAPHRGVWTTSGNFSPIHKVPGQTLFISSFSDNGLTITEDDYRSDVTHLFDKSVHHYAANGSIQADVTVTTEVDPPATPVPPRLHDCAA